MKIKALVIAGLATGAMTMVPTTALAESNDHRRHSGKHAAQQERRCERIDARKQHLFGGYNQNHHGLNSRLQNLIDRENARECAPTENIVETLVDNGNFTTLTAAVGAAGLAPTLTGGTYTVFAPTDQAFANLPAGTVEALLADIPKLQSILKYHVVAGAVPSATAMSLTSAPTVNGQAVHISVDDGSLYIDDSRVVLYDIKTTNGVIHVIDTVLIP